MQDFVTVASAILGAIVGGIVGAGAPLFLDYWYRPVLVLEEDRAESPRPEAVVTWSGHAISITNKGRRTAKHCHGMITLDAHEDDLCPEDQRAYSKDLGPGFPAKFNIATEEKFLLNKGDWRPVNDEMLAWAQLGNPNSIDIYPDTHPLLDIFRFMNVPGKQPQLQFVSEGGWASLRGAFDVKEYPFTITIGAENARATTRQYKVKMEPNNVSVTAAPVKQRHWWQLPTGRN